jgi:pilus assembly protein TadC
MKKNTKLQKNSFIKNLIVTKNTTKLIVYIVSGVLVSLFISLGILALLGILTGFLGFMDYFVLAMLSGTGVYGMYQSINVRKISKIDAIFPDFVRDLAESRRAGMTFTKAILFASKGEYGILTPEIQKISQQVSWGGSVSDALQAFAKRVNNKSIRRTITLNI